MSKWYRINIAQLLVLLEKLNSITLLKTTFMLSTVSNFLPLKTSLGLEAQNLKLWVNNLSLTCLLLSNDCSILSSRSLTCLGCQSHNHFRIYNLLMSQLMGKPKKLISLSKLHEFKNKLYKLKDKNYNPKNKYCRPRDKNYRPMIKSFRLKNKLWKFKRKNFLRSRMKINQWNLN